MIIAGYPFRSPPIRHQKAISSVLGRLDEKIDLNRRMNETLEAMARAIFKDWFVDFGPRGRRWKAARPTSPREIWSLFPDRLDNEGKPRGEGGKRQSIFDQATRVNGAAYKNMQFHEMPPMLCPWSLQDCRTQERHYRNHAIH